MSMEWWRCKHGAPYDPKWRAVAARAGADVRPGDVWSVFTALCDRASQAADRGSLEGLDLEDVSAGLGYDIDQVSRIVTALKAKSLIDDERVTTWVNHQPKKEDDSAAERKRLQRERDRNAQKSATDFDVPAMSRYVTQSHAREEKIRVDTDTEKKRREKGGERSQARAAPKIQPEPPEPVVLKKPQRWPADAVVPDDWLAAGAESRERNGLPPIDLRLQAEQFQNYWAAKSGGAATKTDWRATWINWCLRAYENGGKAGKNQSSHPFGVFGALLEKERRRESAQALEPEAEQG